MKELISKVTKQFGRVETTMEGMSPRDRTLIYLMVLAFGAAILVLSTMMFKSKLGTLEGQLASGRAQLALVQESKAAYLEGQELLVELEAKLKAHEGTSLSAFLEKSASKAQIRDNLNEVKERSVTTLESMEEKQSTAQIDKITLEQLVSLLYEIETQGYPLIIRSAKITQRRKLLNVTLEISSFKVLEGE